MTRINMLIMAATLVLVPGVVSAQHWVLYGGGAVELLSDPGESGEGAQERLELYLEAERGPFYVGIWGLADSNSLTSEIDAYFGLRQSFDNGFDYDLNYTRYIYPNDGGDCCGEIGLSLGQTFGEKVYVSTEGYWDPEISLGSAYVLAEVYATDKITLDASYGLYNVAGADNEREWEIGVGYAVTDSTALDFRWYDGSDYEGYFGFRVTFDTTLFGG